MEKKTIIAISREFGSGGRLIGKKLAEKLGVKFYDKELIELTARRSGLSPDFIETAEQHATNSFLYTIAASANAGGNYIFNYNAPVADKAFFAQSSVIRDLAKEDSCVIVGRCAGYILRDDPACVSIFLHASLDSRLNRCINEYGLDPKGLADKLTKTDKARANYHRYYTGDRWDDLRAYDLVLSTTKLTVDAAVDIIYEFLENRTHGQA